MQQTRGDEGVYHGEGIGDYARWVSDCARFGEWDNELEDEIICITWRWSKHDDYRDEPVLEESHEWSIEGFVTGPETGPWDDAFAADFLDDWLSRLAPL